MFCLSLLVEMPTTQAANQVFAMKAAFTAQGELQRPLILKFSGGDETRVKATIKGNASDHRILSLACLDGSDIFMYSLDNGYDYAMYTVSMRDNEHQEILILSYDKRTTGKTNLNGISVIGNDSVNRVALLPLQGFRQVSVLNSPLQIKSDRTAQLYRDKLRAMVTIAWDEKGKSFRVSGIED